MHANRKRETTTSVKTDLGLTKVVKRLSLFCFLKMSVYLISFINKKPLAELSYLWYIYIGTLQEILADGAAKKKIQLSIKGDNTSPQEYEGYFLRVKYESQSPKSIHLLDGEKQSFMKR